jgi:DUF438 domain-containing protein
MNKEMENTAIINYPELLFRLKELKLTKENSENELKLSFTEFMSTVDIVSLFSRQKNPENIQQNLLKTGINMALNLVTGLVFGKNRSVKGYLSALMIERFTTMVIDNNLIGIVAGIGSMIFKKRNRDKNPE